MAKKTTTSSFPNRKPLPWYGWAILITLIGSCIGGLWYWRIVNVNEWTHLQKLGIRMPMRYQIHGIDVSHHNPRIDWERVRQMRFEDLRLQFAFIKATEGTSMKDSDFKKNWAGADGVGLYRGAYHFYVPWKEPVSQATNFISTVRLKKGDLPPVLDFEIGTNAFTQQQVIRNLQTWLTLVERHYGVKPIIYTNLDFYRRYVKGNLDAYPLWIADYSRLTLDRYDDATILFWQHSKAGWVEGIRGVVDYNVFLGTDEELKRLTVQ